MRAQGFSLFELIITLVIISIVSAIALPAVTHMMRAYSADILLDDVVHFINLAQQAADINHVPIVLCQSQGQMDCVRKGGNRIIIFVNDKEEGINQTKKSLLYAKDIDQTKGHLFFRSFPSYRDFILFQPIQYLQTDNGLFWYCLINQSEPRWAIVLSKSGRVRMVKPDREHHIYDSHHQLLRCS